MISRLFFISLFLGRCFFCFAQQYSYTNYTNKDGLAGNTVYSMCQDKDGFMWFGTESGVSRFDGTKFKNFTVADGLPDNEILFVYCDKKGRVWMAPFRKSVCYYYKGKIYNQENDPVLKKVSINGVILKICDDKDGNVMLMQKKQLLIVAHNGEITEINRLGKRNNPDFVAVGESKNGDFLIMDNNLLYEYKYRKEAIEIYNSRIPSNLVQATKITKDACISPILINNNLIIQYYSLADKTSTLLPYPVTKVFGISTLEDSLVYYGTTNGAFAFNIGGEISQKHFLPGLSISNVYKDKENNTWFLTLKKGVYRLNPENIVLVPAYDKENNQLAVSSFSKGAQNDFIACYSNRSYSRINLAGQFRYVEYESYSKALGSHIGDDLLGIYEMEKGDIFFGGNARMILVSEKTKTKKWAFTLSFKNLAIMKENEYLIATNVSAIVFNSSLLQVTDTVLHERTTAVCYSNDTIYAGTLDGLVMIPQKKSPVYLWKESAVFKNRIIRMTKTDNGILWLATYNNGLVGCKNGKAVAAVNEQNGLGNNNCRDFFADGNILWVATNKGLSKIDASETPKVLANYTVSDGLSADVVNAVYVFNGKVYAGTAEGINYFDERQLQASSICDLKITDIRIADEAINADRTFFSVPHQKNTVSFEYAGISFRSGGEIRYHYRLLGIDSNWKTTREHQVSYPALPSGKYELQLYAVNKFGVASKTAVITFEVEKLLLEKVWVWLLMLAGIGGLAWLLINWRLRVIKKRHHEKESLINAVHELEQLALKSQMNPHFIFNSLNSIQQYVIDKDVEGANKFISSFSRLIRKTLDFSTSNEITLQEEISYLSDYLELEKNRLEGKFSYFIEVDNTFNQAELVVPPLLLQPFVENAVRHGVRYRNDNHGLISISFKKKNSQLVCVIEDNGVGRKASMSYKTSNTVEYQSKGMSLTSKRIEALNKKNNEKIEMKVEDAATGAHLHAGTKVTVTFPFITSKDKI